MKELIVKKGIIYINGIMVDVDEYLTIEYLEYINLQSKRFELPKSFFTNEIFLSLIFNSKLFIYEYILKKEKIEKVIVYDYSLNNIYIRDATFNLNISFKQPIYLDFLLSLREKINNISSLISFISYLVMTLFFMTYQIFKNHKPLRIDNNKKFIIVHCKAGLNKIKKYIQLKGNDFILFIDPSVLPINNNQNCYSTYSLISWTDHFEILKSIFKKSYLGFLDLKIVISNNCSSYTSSLMLKEFSKRIPHYIYTKRAMKNILSFMNDNEFIHTEKESRWGALCNDLAKSYNKNPIGIPHGLEYAIKFPLEIFGEKVYCTSVNAERKMKNLYPERNFIYDSKLQEVIYSCNINDDTKRKIIFFTEGRNHFKDEEIINQLIKSKIDFYIKLHPLDSLSNYSLESSVKFIHDYRSAISNNVCIARNSSILLESTYNNSIPISIIVDSMDKFICDFLYPSLNHEAILKIYSVKELINRLSKNIL